MLVCYHCFDESNALKRFIDEHGTRGDCPTCGTANTTVLEAEELYPIFEGLRGLYEVAEPGLHYVYDSETGDELFDNSEALPQKLQDDWPIFSDAIDDDDMSSIVGVVWDDWDDTSRYTSEELFHEGLDEKWEVFCGRLKHKHRFFMPADQYDPLPYLRYYLERCEEFTPGGDWFRARLGKYEIGSIGAPPPEEVRTAGRANPAGISFLYLSDAVETTMAEVRAEPGELVSVGACSIRPNTRVADLTQLVHRGVDPFAHQDLKPELEKMELLRKLSFDLSRPVIRGQHELDCVPTQYFVECIRSLAYDGVLFDSSLAQGKNLVLFEPDIATFNSVKHYRVTRKQLAYQEVQIEFEE